MPFANVRSMRNQVSQGHDWSLLDCGAYTQYEVPLLWDPRANLFLATLGQSMKAPGNHRLRPGLRVPPSVVDLLVTEFVP
jgi:hypothetical protein